MLQEVIGITFKVYNISTSTRHLGNWFVWSWLSEENSRRQGHMKDIGPDKNWEQISDLVISPEHQTLIFSLGENRNFADFYKGNFSRMDSFMLMRPHFRHFFWATLPNLWEGKKSGGRWQQVCSSTNAVTLPEIQIQANFATFSFAIKKGICKFIPYSWDYVVSCASGTRLQPQLMFYSPHIRPNPNVLCTSDLNNCSLSIWIILKYLPKFRSSAHCS